MVRRLSLALTSVAELVEYGVDYARAVLRDIAELALTDRIDHRARR